MDQDNFTSPSSLKTNSEKSSEGSKFESTPSPSFQISPEIGSEESPGVRSESISVEVKKARQVTVKIKVEFFDETDDKTFSRVSTDLDIINK